MFPQHPEDLGILAGMVMREDGTLRWPVIVGGILSAGAIALAVGLNDMSRQIAAIDARQQIVMQQLRDLTESQHPATAKRFTSDDAIQMEERLTRRIEKIEERTGHTHKEK